MSATFDASKTPVTSEPQKGPAAQKASHDSAPPKALLDFMLKDWKPASKKPVSAVKHARSYFLRRRKLSQAFPGETLVIATGHEKVRANDTHYRFRPGTDFFYFTGNLEPDCVLVLEPKEGGGHKDLLFVEPNPGRSDATFYTDRVKGELWVGPRLGVEQSRRRFGVDEARGLPELKDYLKKRSGKVRVLRGFSDKVDGAVSPNKDGDRELAQVCSELRLIKDRLEVLELQAVIDATQRGFEDVIRSLPGARSERTVEGVFNLRAREEGNDVGYGTIAAAGANACILHWTRNDGPVRDGELLLLDAGVEGNSLYTADITRTLPINGRFSKEQREIYELVLAAQKAAFKKCKPGEDFLAPNRAAMEVLAQGLERLGILPTTAEEALRDENQFYKRYSLHNVSHMLGLDVHDCAQARQEVYKFGQQRAGMVFTVEPGLYFQLDDLTVPARYRGIGVRIEDDVLITAKGMTNLSANIPSEADEVEDWIASLWKDARKGAQKTAKKLNKVSRKAKAKRSRR